MMDKDNKAEGEGFVIKDKRSSQASEDEVREEESRETPSETQEPPGEGPGEQPFQIDFSTFVLSLTSSAFYHLGDMADPTTGKTETNLPAVQQTIDMLIMLKEKTKGNLSSDEAKLIEQLIYELQMKYVAKSKK
ncbi:MAG: DUF1844 domain-containing protein [Nitrospinaceae bacterium]